MITNEQIREFLIGEYGEDKGNAIVLMPYYSAAFIGVSMGGRAIYDFDKMVLFYATENHMTLDEARKIVKNDIAAIVKSVDRGAPIINLGCPF